MDQELFLAIKSRHYKWNRIQCFNFANKFLKIIAKKYPEGIPQNQYFVIPGYEDMTKFQPIVMFDIIEQAFILTSSTLFFTPSKSIKTENYAS
jgi:hypothetical protein